MVIQRENLNNLLQETVMDLDCAVSQTCDIHQFQFGHGFLGTSTTTSGLCREGLQEMMQGKPGLDSMLYSDISWISNEDSNNMHSLFWSSNPSPPAEELNAIVPSTDIDFSELTEIGLYDIDIFPEDIQNMEKCLPAKKCSLSQPFPVVSSELSCPENFYTTHFPSAKSGDIPQVLQQCAHTGTESKTSKTHETPRKAKVNNRKTRRPKQLMRYSGHGQLHLWQFILRLLTSQTHASDICWTFEEPYEFKILQPDNVARLWGEIKGKKKMNYEKLSRGIRYYYGKNIIIKRPGERYVYRFVCDIERILGYNPTQCQTKLQLVEKSAKSQITKKENVKQRKMNSVYQGTANKFVVNNNDTIDLNTFNVPLTMPNSDQTSPYPIFDIGDDSNGMNFSFTEWNASVMLI